MVASAFDCGLKKLGVFNRNLIILFLNARLSMSRQEDDTGSVLDLTEQPELSRTINHRGLTYFPSKLELCKAPPTNTARPRRGKFFSERRPGHEKCTGKTVRFSLGHTVTRLAAYVHHEVPCLMPEVKTHTTSGAPFFICDHNWAV